MEAHIKLFDNLVKLSMRTPIIPDVDGLSYDFMLNDKKVQAKVARKESTHWSMGHKEFLGPGNQRAASFKAYDALWAHCGDDQFVLLPASVLRRHSAFFGQGSSGKGRGNLFLYHGFSPTRGDAPKWQQLCAPYVFSWTEAGLKAKVETVLASC